MREESGVASSLLSLPSGGGGVSPLGDRFEPDLLRGSGSYAVAIHCPKGPNGVQPSLTLTYSTGSGNGAFGLGWRLNTLRIERRSDRGVPGYTDDDTFVIGDAEVLVPVGGNRYRPKSDTKFWFIERTGDSWRIRTGDGHTMMFGQTAASREESGGRIFAWRLDEERDAAGVMTSYSYRADAGTLYLEQVRYSIFRVAFVYEARSDVLINGRAGYVRRTALRAARVDLHCDRLAPSLMRSYTFTYDEAANGASLLKSVELSGSADEQPARAPTLRFGYSTCDLNAWRVHQVQAATPPPSLETGSTQLVDLTGDGLPDVVQSTGARMYLWRNRGNGSLDGPERIESVPSTVGLERDNVAFADLNADGRVDLFAVDQPLQLAFSADGRGGFAEQPVVFQQTPTVRLGAPDTRLLDMDGDGVTDLLTTGRNQFLLFRHEPGVGFLEPEAVTRNSDLEQFPDITFGDRGVRIADMSGDGLTDMVLVQSGDVSYWPNLGNGVWGSRVHMENSPVFPAGYRDEQVHVLDLDNDGCSDIVYFDAEETLIWLNRSGMGFTDPVVIPFAPRVRTAKILAADFFGDGRPGFLWTSTIVGDSSSGYRFLRFDEGRKPYLMTNIENGMGRRTTIEYATSTTMHAQDDAEGRPWTSLLPFAIQVVREIRDADTVFSAESRLSIRYHDGVYDGPEREFRGFSGVTVDFAGDDSIAATRQEYSFFQGDPEAVDPAARMRDRALSGSLLSMRLFEDDGGTFRLRHETTNLWNARTEFASVTQPVFFPFLLETEAREHSFVGSPDRVERTRYSNYDAYGNAGVRTREWLAADDPPSKILRMEERFVYSNNEPAWLVKLPVRSELRDAAGLPFSIKVYYYDGIEFTGRPEGVVDTGLLTRTQELVLLEARLPAGYAQGRDFDALGYELTGSGDTHGYYATTFAVQRDALGNVLEQRDPIGAPTTFVYDADGVYPIRKIDPRGKVTEVSFHPPAGEPARVATPDGRVFRSTFDSLGRVVANFEADNAGTEQLVKCWITDTEHVPNSMTVFAARVPGRTAEEFTSAADLTAISGASVVKIYFDGFGNSAMQVATGADAPGGGRRFVASGQRLLNARKMIAVEFPPSFVANFDVLPVPAIGDSRRKFRYDGRGNVVATEGPGPARSRIVIDTFSVEHFEDQGPAPAVRTETFDARNRVVRIEERESEAATVVTLYDLSLDGRITTIRDGAGLPIVEYAIAGPDEPVRIQHRDAGTRTYYRDAAGRVSELVRADASSLFYKYDVAGRLTRLDHRLALGDVPAPVREIFYDTDPGAPGAGRFLDERVALVRETDVQIRYSYDRAGLIVGEEVTTGGTTLATAWEHNLQREVVALTYPDGRRITNELDSSGAVQQITGVLTGISWNANGQNDGYTFSNGIRVSMPADPISQRLESITARNGAATLRRLDYGYDATGNVITIMDETQTSVQHQTYAYDGLHRLTSVTARVSNAAGAIVRSENFSYDPEGNLHTVGSPALTLGYGDAARPGRLTSVTDGITAQTVTYDSRGAFRSWGNLTSIEFDALDRVSRIVTADGDAVRFAYDPQNRRVMKEVTRGGITTTTRYASELFEQRGNEATRRIYLGSRLVAIERITGAVTNPEYFVFDHHGTLLTRISAAGAVLDNQRYSPFGLALESPPAIDQYLGHERDLETGLIQLGARYYAPALGRFISPDWYVLENPNRPMRMPQGFNVYSYSLNNPLAFKDPSGKWFFLIPFVVGFVAGLVYGLADGQGWSAFGTAFETALTTSFGALLGGAVLGGFGAVMGGINGFFTGVRKIYDWDHIEGWASFIADSSWGIIGTSIGNVLNIVNLIAAPSSYRSDLSKRQNRQVYDKGFAFEGSAAFTQGNVISNLQGGGGAGILKHETVHILQNRLLGPVYTAGYAAWLGYGAYYGFWIGLVLWPFIGQDPLKSIRDIAYDDNPFELWAYSVQGDDGNKGKLAI